MFVIMERIIIQLPRELLKELDRAAKEMKMTRAALIRNIVDLALAERRRNEEIAAIIRSFEERPQTEDEYIWSQELARKVWPD
jgi:metal-responsive CopG/Arc/MetJ family transcriptional regulator